MKHIIHWRTWLKAGSAAFTICIFTVLIGDMIPKILFGYSTSEVLKNIVQVGFYLSIVLFFISFVCLAWRQS